MSVSIHMNGQKRGDMKKAIHQHQVRLNEKDSKEAVKHSESSINPKLSSMNINYFDDADRFTKMRKKLDVISNKRVESGGKRLYKSANVMMTGTIQLSDETLGKLGWKWDKYGNKLPANEQSEIALTNVKRVYKDAVKSVTKQGDTYGDIFSATLHLDEGSPHVDFMSDPLDENKPDQTARTFLNGEKGTKKGVAMKRMQDNILKHTRFDSATLEKFDLKRGNSIVKKIDKIKTIRKDELKLSKGLKVLDESKKRLEKRESRLREKEEQLRRANNMLVVQVEDIKKRERVLMGCKDALDVRERKIDQKDGEVDKKLVEVNKLVDLANETKSYCEVLKSDIWVRWQEILESVKKGVLRSEQIEDKILNVKSDTRVDDIDKLMLELEQKLEKSKNKGIGL